MIGQLLTIAASPILTRLYSPEQMGVLAIYIAITSILTVVLSLRYETAIALPESNKEALALVRLSLYIVFIVSWIVGLLAIYNRHYIAEYFNMPELSNYLFLLPISGILLGSFMVLRVWCIRAHAFSLVGKARIKQVISSLIIQIFASPLGAIGLIGGQIANQGAGTLSLAKEALRHPEMRQITFADMKKMLIRYKDFPLLFTWSSLLNRISQQFPILFFASMFGPAAAGIYALANRTLKAPSAAVNSAINSVFLTAAAEANHQAELKPLIIETHKYLCSVTVPALLLISLFSPQLFSIVFGDQWAIAGDYARWMTLLIYCTIVITPFMGLFAVLERQGIGLVFQIFLFLIRLFVLYIGSKTEDAVFTVALFCVASWIVYTAILAWVGSLVDNGITELVQHTIAAALWAVALNIPIILALATNSGTLITWVMAGISAMLCAWKFFTTSRSTQMNKK